VTGLGLETPWLGPNGRYTSFYVLIDDRTGDFIAAFPAH